MRKELRFIFLLLLLSSIGTSLYGAKRYWIATTTQNWNSTANWSSTSGGASGSSVPGSSDTAYFDATKVGSCTINATANVKRFDVASGYTGTISQGASIINIGIGNGIFSGGTFTGGSAGITCLGSLTISGGAFTSTSGTLTVVGTFVLSSGSFSHNNGTVLFNTPNTITGTFTFYKLVFVPGSAGNYTISNTITTSNDLIFLGSIAVILDSGTINATGNVFLSNTATSGGGSATINFNNTNNQTINGNGVLGRSAFPKVVINKSSGTLTLTNIISVANDWTWTAGTFSLGSSVVAFVNTLTIAGTHTLGAVKFQSDSPTTYTISNTLTVSGTLTTGGIGALTFNTGTISPTGTVALSNTGTGGGGSATFSFTNSANQSIIGNATVGQSALPKVTINKSSGTLSLSNTISVANDWTWTAGALSPGSSVVAFVNSLTIAGTHSLGAVTFKSSSATTFTIANILTASGTLLIDGTGAITFNTGTIAASGNVTVTNTSTGGGGSATIRIDGASPTLTGAAIAGQGVLPNLTFNNSSAATYTIAASTTVTTGGTLTIAGTGALTFNTGALYAYGNITITNSGTGGGGSATLSINGTGSQLLTGNATAGQGALPKVTINKSSGTLTLASTISVANDWTWTAGTFSLGSSVVAFVNTLTIAGTHTLGAVTFQSNSSATYTISNTLTVSGTLTTGGNGTLIFNTGTISPTAAVTLSNTGTGAEGTATFSFTNTNNQTITGNSTVGQSALPKVTINKSSGTLTLVNTISVANDWTWTAGTFSLGSSVVAFVNSLTIAGAHTLGTVIFQSNSADPITFTISNTLTVSGTLTTGGISTLTFNTGTISPTANVILSNTGTGGGGTATFSFTNTNNQTITGNGTVGQSNLPKVTINKSSGTLTLASTISVANDWTWTAGTFSLGSSVVAFVKSLTISGNHTLENVVFSSNSTATFAITTGNTLQVGGTLTTAGTGSVTLNGGTLAAKGPVAISNVGSSGGGTTSLLINGGSNQTLTGSGSAGTGLLPRITINKSGGILTLISIISVGGDWNYISDNTIDATTNLSTLAFYGTGNVDGQGTTTTMDFYNVIFGGTSTLTGNLSATNNLTINPGSNLSAGSNSITVGGNWTNNVGTWTCGTSSVTFNGSGYNQISRNTVFGPPPTETFYNLGFNRTSGSITLSISVIVNNVLTLTKGHVKSSTTAYLSLIDNATVIGGSDSAYVHGPVRKTGDDAFVFPLGDTTLADTTAYHPLGISAPAVNTDQFEATYFAQASPNAAGPLDPTLEGVSNCEYWTCAQKSGSSSVILSLDWNYNSCRATGTEEMTIVQWDASLKWVPVSSAVTAYGGPTGTISSISPVAIGLTPIHFMNGSKKIDGVFVPSRPMLDGFTARSYGKMLFVIYDEKYKAGNLNYTIYDMNHQPVNTAVVPVTKVYGRNWLKINLAPQLNMVNNRYYVLEIQNDKGQKEYVRFCLK